MDIAPFARSCSLTDSSSAATKKITASPSQCRAQPRPARAAAAASSEHASRVSDEYQVGRFASASLSKSGTRP
jgi:hypothetical protein